MSRNAGTITELTITPKQVAILRYLSGKRWRTCEEWSAYSRKDVEPLVAAGLADCTRGGFRSSRRGITPAGRALLACLDSPSSRQAALVRAQSADLLPLYEAPPERLAAPGELKGRMGFEFKKTVTIARVGGPGGLRAVHAALLGAPFCDFTDEPVEKWAGVGHEWVQIAVSSIEESTAVQMAGELRSKITCAGCLGVLSSGSRTIERMLEIVRAHG